MRIFFFFFSHYSRVVDCDFFELELEWLTGFCVDQNEKKKIMGVLQGDGFALRVVWKEKSTFVVVSV